MSDRQPFLTRPVVLGAVMVLTLTGCVGAPEPSNEATPTPTATSPEKQSSTPTSGQTLIQKDDQVEAEITALEREYDARVGVSAIDTASGETVVYRAEERFGYASTLKVFAAAQMLRQVPSEDRGTRITWTQGDVDAAGYSPVTSVSISEGMTLIELAEAAVRASDNTAMNLVLEHLGGPGALDAALQDLGDDTTEVVNTEPDLNMIEEGQLADTTTATAFTAVLTSLLGQGCMAPADRAILIEWMSDNATGDPLIRAGAPAGWQVSDKSGGAGPIRNDIAVVTPPGRAPIILTIFTTRNDPAQDYDDSLVARTATAVLTAFS